MKAGFNSPFQEQADFFRNKLNLPSERWDDIQRSAHDRAFIVAGVQKADLLADLHDAVQTSIDEGKSIEWFREQFDTIAVKHGWTDFTGSGSAAGIAWRTRIIYSTNISTSYAAGRWAQLNDPGLVKMRPYLKYHHADGVMHPRPLHVAWNGLVLPRDDPFWLAHYPPNGWLCHCYVSAASQKDYGAAAVNGHDAPPDNWQDINPKTGAEVGIDKGFDYTPGANVATSLRDMVAAKLINYPPAIAAALRAELGDRLPLP